MARLTERWRGRRSVHRPSSGRESVAVLAARVPERPARAARWTQADAEIGVEESGSPADRGAAPPP